MATDLNKKTLRHFYCRDKLWQSFERMSEDLDRGIDDLVNEAMRLLAREKGYMPGEADTRPPTIRQGPPRPPPPPVPVPRAMTQAGFETRRTGAHAVIEARIPGPSSAVILPPPPPPPREDVQNFATVDEQAHTPPLYVLFENQKYLVDKDQFIIGRGVKSSDLPIKDGNISRKHAAVVRRDGAYYIKDLGSTNGIDFNGTRIDNKRIEEGDLYFLCDHQLRFTYR